MAVDDQYTKSLMHFDGNIADESGKIWTSFGGIVTSSTQSKFGGKSLYFDGVDDYIVTESNTDFNFSTGDATIDFWAYPVVISNSPVLIDKRTIGGAIPWVIQINPNGTLQFYDGGSAIPTTAMVTVNAWNHIEMSKIGSDITISVGGIMTTVGSSRASIDTTGSMYLGRAISYGTYNYNGYIDEFRVSKGIARHTSNFAPPTEPYGSTKYFPQVI